MPLFAHNTSRPFVAEHVYIAPTAAVIGDVTLDELSSVWFGAVLRGDDDPIRIGPRSNVQDNAVVHAGVQVGEDTTVGHMALLHGCTIGDRCLIGMGSLLLDGVVIEDEAIVAAGSLVPPGTRVPSGSLFLGRPARRVRALREADITEIFRTRDLYMGKSKRFAEIIHPVSLRLLKTA